MLAKRQKTLFHILSRLERTPSQNFCKGQQTFNFDPKYIGYKHCAIGWLLIPKNALYYNKEHAGKVSVPTDPLIHAGLTHYDVTRIVHANNNPHEYDGRATIKTSVLKEIRKIIASSFQDKD